jgi:hypothetical protein
VTAPAPAGDAPPVPEPRSAAAGLRYLPVVLAAVVMVGCAQATGQRAIMFPEGVALAFGVWVVGRADWCASRPRLVLAPLLCASCGVLMTHLLTDRLPAELAALSCAVLILLAMPSQVGPALSAAVLPAVFDVRSWIYPLAVLAVTLVVAAGQSMLQRGAARARERRSVRRWPVAQVLRFWALAALWLAVVTALGLPTVAAAPPLLVSALEWLLTGSGVGWRTGWQRGVLLVLAWTAGSVAAWQIPSPSGAAACACLFAAALMWLARVPHAPILAMALVADVAGPAHSWSQTVRGAASIAVAISVLYLMGAAGRGRATRDRPGSRTVDRRMSLGATGLRHLILAGNPGRSRSPS